MSGLQFTVHGIPAAQGSKRHVGNGIMIESSKKVKPWRQDVVAAAVEAMAKVDGFEPFAGPVFVAWTFYFPRPKSHFRTGKRAHELKPNAPRLVATLPDIEKVIRSSHDALTTAGVWRDDRLAAKVTAEKLYHDHPGATVLIQAVAP